MDVDRLLGKLLGSKTATFAGGALAGGLAGSMLSGKTGRKVGKKVLKYGALAAVGGLAYAAWKSHNEKKSGGASAAAAPAADVQAPPADSGFLPPASDDAAREELGMTLVRAMIAAARADGRMDEEETERVFSKIDELGLDAEERSALLDAMRNPPDVDALVRAATSPQVALEIYAASRMAIEPDTAAERAWLQMLAARLELEDGLVQELESRLVAV